MKNYLQSIIIADTLKHIINTATKRNAKLAEAVKSEAITQAEVILEREIQTIEVEEVDEVLEIPADNLSDRIINYLKEVKQAKCEELVELANKNTNDNTKLQDTCKILLDEGLIKKEKQGNEFIISIVEKAEEEEIKAPFE